ncbi:hypothetical protein EMCG_04152 [[Emmonsia] crescens]|uniref:Uncharacterized protein n=1 Tax=[Emmonsia] crescens TaxID=73230 RepID=A0A0G2IZ87_9EURO|nr:hypothetical protein EMCG_04152 [Emmonsia crescens UAMH 3008]
MRPPPTAVRMRAASSANNNDRSPTPMRGPAVAEIAAGGVESSNQNSNTLNKLQLKLQISHIECEKAEIERDNLRLHLKLMKHQSNHPNQSNQSNSNLSNPPDSPISHLHGRAPEYDPDSLIGKKITTFLHTAKLVLKLINLNGSSNYLVWRESILSHIETAKCHLILNNEEEISSFDEQQDTIF